MCIASQMKWRLTGSTVRHQVLAESGRGQLLSGRSRLEAALGCVRTCRIDVEVNDFDAQLRCLMARAGMPRTVAKPDIADLRQEEATPFAAGRLARAAF